MPTTMTAETKSKILEAVKAANAAPFSVGSGPSGGCGRAYVVLTADRATVNAVAAACKKLGLMFLRKAYGTSGPSIYLGYDNASGRALAKSRAFAEVLNARGIACYDDAVGD